MTETKYGKHVIREPFYKASDDFGGAMIFKHAGEDNSGVTYEYHCINKPGWSLNESRTHDTHELLCFLGGNPKNILDFKAEVSIHLGEVNEEHIIDYPTIVSIPTGLKHGPITVNQCSSPFVLLRILNTKEYQNKLNSEAQKPDIFTLNRLTDGNVVPKHGKKYWMNMFRGPFYVDYEPGWTGTSVWSHNNDFKNGTTLGYHCIVTPYDVRHTHTHDFHELLCFLSGDPENIRDLGAEVSIRLGEEQEIHSFNTPAIISMPPGLKHCPLLVKNITKPVVFLEVSTTKNFVTYVE
jgi:hypothetical protein